MSNDVTFSIELAVRPGELDRFKALINEMVEYIEANEPGTVVYECHLSEDGRRCHLYERYTDSSAVSRHLESFGQRFAARFGPAVETQRFVVYGDPSDEIRQAISGGNPVYMPQFNGFKR